MQVKYVDIDKGRSYIKLPQITTGEFKKIPELIDLGNFQSQHIIFSPLTQIAYLIDDEAYRILSLKIENNNFFSEFIKSGIFIKDQNNLFPKPKIQKFEPKNNITIFLTRRCNLRCKYCYASGGEMNENIDLNFARVGIDFAFKSREDPLKITFHGGGEPFLAFDLMKKILVYAKNKTDKVVATAVTNGLLNEKMIDFVLNNFKNLMISYDGPPSIQDVHRPMINGRPSSLHVEKTIKMFDENGWIKNIGIRSTISAFSENKMTDIVNYFYSYGLKKVIFEPLFEVGRAKNTGIEEPNLKIFAENFLKALELAEDYNMNLSSSFLPLGVKCSFCDAAGSNFALTTDGYITSCYEKVSGCADPEAIFIYGRYDKKERKIIVNEKKINFLGTRTVYNMKSCQDCIAKWSCAGGCLIKTFQYTGDLFKPLEKFCVAKRDILRKYIRFRIEKDIIKAKHCLRKYPIHFTK